MALLKKPYEISVWEDKIKYVGKNSNNETIETFNISDLTSVEYQYYTEQRLATIGSHTMTSPTRALEPTLTRNINGIETLKFEMYYQYIDPNTGERVHNPLIDLLVNERKVKLYYNDDDPNHPDHWYDFIIKKDEEKARDNKYIFTCNSLAAHELGKTGFSIELDTELENNMGTVQELGEKVLKDSDWQLAAQGQDVIQQTINEPLYKILTNTSLTANLRVPKDGHSTKLINAHKYIYVYYTPYAKKETDYFQFIYIEDNANIKTLSDGITLVCDDENVWDLYLTNVNWIDDKPDFQSGDVSVAEYRGDRYVRRQKTTYDSILKRTVNIYEDNSDPARTVYGYQTTRYYDVNSIYNYIHNSTNFGGTSYWTAYSNGEAISTIDRVIYPSVNANNVDDERKNYLSVYIGNDSYDYIGALPSDFSTGYTKYYYKQDDQYIRCNADDTNKAPYYLKQRSRVMNNGIVYNYSKINTFDKGEKYLFRVKVKGYDKDTDTLSGYLNNRNPIHKDFPFTCQVRKYIKIDKYTEDDELYFNFLGGNAAPDYDLIKDLTEDEFNQNKIKYYYYENNNFIHCNIDSIFDENTSYFILSDYAIIEAECQKGASWNDLKDNLGIFLFRSSIWNLDGLYTSYFIEDIQLYKAIPREEGGYYQIGDVPEVKFETVNHYYYPDENGTFTNPDDYIYITDNNMILTPIFGSGAQEFEKVRSLSKKESNRFNLLQELCETFQCWVKFIITHETGESQNEVAGRIRVEDYDYYKPVKPTEEEVEQGSYYIYNYLDKEYQITQEWDENQQYYQLLTRKRQDKKVIFYGEILEDNPLGFKYGINLKDVTRTLDSDQIATKIIVKNNSCESADNGFCSIARAKDNPTKENFLYNFDYYIKQGILNQSTLYNDLYLDVNGFIGLYPKLADYNSKRNDLINDSTEIATHIMQLTSTTQEALLEYNSANEELQKLIDPISGKLYKYTNYIYDDFINQIDRSEKARIRDNIEANQNVFIPAQKQIYYLKRGNNSEDNLPPSGGLTDIKEKNNSDINPIGIRYFYKQINMNDYPSLTGAEIRTNHGEDVDGNHFKEGWYSLKYYYEDGNYYRRCREKEKIIDNRTYIYFGLTDKTPFYIKDLSNGFLHYEDKYTLPIDGRTYYLSYDITNQSDAAEIKTDEYFNNELYFQVHKDSISFTYTDTTPEVYIYGAYKRIYQASNDDTVNDTKTIEYIIQIQTLEKTKQSAEQTYDEQSQNLKQAQQEYDEITKKLNNIARATDEIEKEFTTKYSRYIQEGSWNDDNYMDDDLYYLDAVNVLYQSAYPKVSYTASVLELSALEGYEPYKFQVAHKTFLEDTEFFGWKDYANQIPARENVVITELTSMLDEPDKNTIKVQNYKSHFEDLFQRIAASTQNLEYHSGDYKRASDAIQADGVIQTSVMQSTLNAAAYILANANNQSVVIDETGLTATKTNAPAEVVKLTSGGILLTNDGENWGVAIGANGINTALLSAGTINTENITIMNGNYPTFKWDGYGLRALAFTQDENNISSYNSNNYVTFDRFGLYGINSISNFVPNNVTDVERKANFALTWNGLFIRSNYREGYVSISPNDDITLYSYGSQTFNSIGAINTINDIYYFNNRSAFYYKQNQNDSDYIQCTTENYSDLSEKNIYVVGFERLQTIPEPITSNYYYLLGGEFIQCIGEEPSDLTNNIFYQKSSNAENGSTAIKRAKFGMIGSNEEELFGIALYDQSGNITVTTQSDGRLWLQDSMRIGTPNQSNTIYIGVGSADTTPGQNRYKVINVNDLNNNEKFIVYSDGTLNASGVNIEGTIHAIDGEFTGTIHATGGDIGGNLIDSNGITIINGGFKIKNDINDENSLFEINESGSIEMTGIIHANGGDFNTGIIGGFTIGQHSIVSEGLELWSKDSDANNPSKIVVENIEIGTGANITNYLNIGNLKLSNPDVGNNNNKVLALTNEGNNYFTLFNNGDIQGENWSIKKDNYYSNIGNLPSDFENKYNEYYYKDGDNYIQCTSSDTDKASYYKKLVTAKFDRGIFTGTINAEDGVFSGAITAATINATTINTINFVTEKVRSMGGAFIFKPTFECKYEESNDQDITIELINQNSDNNPFAVNDIVGFTDSNVENYDKAKGILIGKVKSINNNEIIVTIPEGTTISQNVSTITRFGQSNTDIIIAINSDENGVGNLLKPKSLTISDFNYSNNKLNTNIKLLLGDLSGAKDASRSDLTGYGLYADNVYLHGSLVTEIPSDSNDYTYAGVNTIPTTISSLFPGEKIVFWAGAENYNQANESPFYVTEKGSIYASKGIFTGSVIANSIISKSTIEAAIIKGNGTSPSLKIYDTDTAKGGIGFYKNDANDGILTLIISNNGIFHNYIYNDQSELKPIISFSDSNSDIIIEANKIKNGITNYENGKIQYNNYDTIKFNGSIELNKTDEQYIKITDDNIQLKHSAIINDGEVIFSNTIKDNNIFTTYKLDYKVNNGYYCLYVSQKEKINE